MVLLSDFRIKDISTIKVGGAPRSVLIADTDKKILCSYNNNLFVIGAASNILANDKLDNIDIALIRNKGISFEDDILEIKAGESLDKAVRAACDRNLWGLESLSGIPGTIGGAIYGNAGAYGSEIKDCLESVVIAGSAGFKRVAANKLCMQYRSSAIKSGNIKGIIVSARFRLLKEPVQNSLIDLKNIFHGDCNMNKLSAPSDIRMAVLNIRRKKSAVYDELDTESHGLGSFFINPVIKKDILKNFPQDILYYKTQNKDYIKLSAANLIELSGIYKGFSINGSKIRLSKKHSLCIINQGGGTAREVLELMEYIQNAVFKHFGINLIPEPCFLGFK